MLLEPYRELPVLREQPLSAVRRIIAHRLGETWRHGVLVTLHRGLEAGALVEAAERIGHSPFDLLLRAVVQVLGEDPRFNATFDGTTHRMYGVVNLGVAVDTPKGVVVPVLRNAHVLSLEELARTRREVTERVRAWQHRLEDLLGATFTVSQLGPLQVDAFTPIPNPPQVAILGVGRLQYLSVAWWPERTPQLRWILPASLTFDHRVVDGADAARFLQRLQELLKGGVEPSEP
ncbi:MAG: 2-oxo acid dehydrogenase subunit E2 [Armatimonadota bacterium]|nr:2-oxo acid dehydrogenase subunit E2 [Armatimonadota bacterium]MDR7567877.1 2-oxo acid dehydrogenase subunit E2 [Armatimonadota bacterium]